MRKFRIILFICYAFVFVHSAEANPKGKAYASTVIKLSQDRVLFRTIGVGDYEAARRLLTKDANVNAADLYGDTLLAYAVMQGDSRLVKLLNSFLQKLPQLCLF
jgi:ankyrin repeat protein